MNSIGVQAPGLGEGRYILKKIWGKFLSLMRYLKKAESNIYVFTPLALPQIVRWQRAVQRINKALLLIQLRIVLKVLKFERPVLWVCLPTFKDIAIALKKDAKCLVYYCVDNIAHYNGVLNPYIAELETVLQRNADVSFFVNHDLAEKAKAVYPSTFHLGHGVDYEHFSKAQSGMLPKPGDLEMIKGPIVGYIGALVHLDYELVKFLAKKNRDISFVFIGNVQGDISAIKNEQNVYFLGKKDYDQLPNYLQEMTCLSIFYATDNVFGQYRNPKKLLEYLASGKPIVSVPIMELKYFQGLITVAEDYEAFDRAIHEAISLDTLQKKNNRIQYAKDHTWDQVSSEAAVHMAASMK